MPTAVDPMRYALVTIVPQKAVGRGDRATDRSKVPVFTREGRTVETIEIRYAAGRQGVRLLQVKHLMPTSRTELDAFSMGVGIHYGRPTFHQGARSFYCTEPRKVCTGQGPRR